MQQANRVVDHGVRQFQPMVVPHANFSAESRVRLGGFVDDVAEAFAQIDTVVHAVQVYGGEHLPAARLAYGAVVKPLGLPLDQDVSDVEDNGADRHARCSAWKATWSGAKVETKK